MFALYLLTLGISAGLVGAFAHEVLSAQGYVPGFEVGVMLTGGVGCAFAAIQFSWLAILRILKPTPSRGLLLCESVSHASVLALAPYLLHVEVAWPDKLLYKVEPLIYLGGFIALHAFLKLISFFAALQGESGRRTPALAYALAACVFGFGAYTAIGDWLVSLQGAQPHAPEEIATYRVGTEHATAQVMPEGTVLEVPVTARPGQCLTLRWANDPKTEEQVGRVYVTVLIEGSGSRRFATSVRLRETGWAGMRIPADQIPSDVRQCTISWLAKKEPGWRRLTGLQPIVSSNRRVLLSGPFEHVAREGAAEPNFVIFCVDGLGAERVASMGYERDTTPSLDRMVYTTFAWPNAYTPTPETEAAAMTLLTGLNPLRHGYLNGRRGPLPEDCALLPELLAQHGYATAAFTEGDGHGDLVFGSGFENGFELFDASYVFDPPEAEAAADAADAEGTGEATEEAQPAPPAGSKVTLDRAQAWIDAHADIKFAVFVRVGELRDLALRERYGSAFIDKEDPRPSPSDVYDTGLAYLDRCMGAVIKHLRDYETRKNTCIVVTSPFGYDFGNGRASVGLSEACLRVPLVMYVPGMKKVQRQDLAALEDVAPTLAEMADIDFPTVVDGSAIFEGALPKAPVSMYGDPLALAIRSEKWRLIWDARMALPTLEMPERRGAVRLYNLSRVEKEGYRDVSSRYPDIVQQWQERLERYVQDNATQPAQGGP